MKEKFQYLEHTGDIGLQIWGNSLEEVFTTSAQGMFSLITETQNIQSDAGHSVSLKADSHSELLVFWLSHLNYLFSTEGFLLSQIHEISIQNGRLTALVGGETYSVEKHVILREIKAVTYHQLILEKRGDEWFAQVIFDL